MNYRKTLIILLVLCIGVFVSCSARKTENDLQPEPKQNLEKTFVQREVKSETMETAEKFMGLLTQGRYDEAQVFFSNSMQEMLAGDQLKNTWNNNLEEVGAFEEILEIRGEIEEPFELITITCLFEKTRANIKMVIAEDGKITGFAIIPE
jgi:hypothetical protein